MNGFGEELRSQSPRIAISPHINLLGLCTQHCLVHTFLFFGPVVFEGLKGSSLVY